MLQSSSLFFSSGYLELRSRGAGRGEAFFLQLRRAQASRGWNFQPGSPADHVFPLSVYRPGSPDGLGDGVHIRVVCDLWGGGGVRCAVAKGACGAAQGRKTRKKCGRVTTRRCQCSPLNSGKKRGKCGACVESLGVGAPSPTGTPVPRDFFKAITSSSDGTKLAAVVYGGNIWTSTDSGGTWRNSEAGFRYQDWQAIASNSDGTKLAAAVRGGNICTYTDPYGGGGRHVDGEFSEGRGSGSYCNRLEQRRHEARRGSSGIRGIGQCWQHLDVHGIGGYVDGFDGHKEGLDCHRLEQRRHEARRGRGC